MAFMLKFSWEMLLFESRNTVAYVFYVKIFIGNLLFEGGDTDVFKAASNKLFASNEKQIENHTL